jgi:hypothetical protein
MCCNHEPRRTQMLKEEEYRAKAEECLRVASETKDSETASLLRTLADDYFALADSAGRNWLLRCSQIGVDDAGVTPNRWRRSFSDLLTEIHYDQSIDQAHDELHVVFNKEDRYAFVAE